MLNQKRASVNEVEIIDASRKLRHGCVLLVALVWLFGPSAALVRGQSYLQSAGSPTFSTQIPIKNGYIDASNGRLHLEVPMGSYPQRGGRPYNVSLNYDGNIWTSTSGTWQPTNVTASDCIPGPASRAWSGWRLVTSGSGCVSFTTTDQGYCNGVLDRSIFYGNWTWTAPDGTVRSFPSVQTEEQGDTCSSAVNASSQGWASDGSGFWMAVTGYVQASVYAPDGTLVYTVAFYHGPEDSNGNYVDEYGPSPAIPGDTLGRLPYKKTVNGSTITYTMSNAQGNTSSVYTVTTSTISAKTNFGQTGVGECITSCTLTVVRSIKVPDNTTYTFQYDCDKTVDSTDCSSPSGQSAYYGLLTVMNLPTGAQIQYSWQPFTDSQGNHYEWINTLITPDSSTGWTFTPHVVTTCGSGQINCQQTFKVIKPNSDETLYTSTLNGGAWASEVDTYNLTTTLLSTVTQCWQYVAPITSGTCVITGPTTGAPATQVQKQVSSTTLPTPTGSVSKTTQFTYDSYGNTTAIEENNYYTGALPSAPDRTTTITYLQTTPYLNALILNRPSSVTVTGGGTVAKTNYCYDYATGCGTFPLTSSFASTSGKTNHDDTNYGTTTTIRGDLTQIQRLVSGSTYLTKSMRYDMTGQLLQETDWSNLSSSAKSYDYTDHFVNGAPPSSTNAYPTKITLALGLYSTSVYYYGTGQLATATDVNGNVASFYFNEALNRPTSTSLPNTGWTLTQYNSTDSQIDRYIGIAGTSGTGCTTCRHDQMKLDGLGRLITSYLVNDPDGQTEVDTQYDSNGRVKTITNPYRSVSDPTYGLETTTYDGSDRAWKVTHADSNVAYTYYGAAITGALGQTTQQCSTSTLGYPVLVVDETGNKRETWTDGFGRVIETDEPDSSGGLTAHTCYAYDLNNNLTGVTATGGTQTRSNAYDMLSRITAKTNPETGTTSFYYTTTIGGSTLCSGDPSAICLRKDARNVTTTYTYDALNRLTQMSYNDPSPTTPTVTYSYDQTSYNGLTIINGKGRRTGMSDGSGQTAWSYNSMGNVLAEARTINGQTKTINYTYNLDGSILTIQYPGTRNVTYAEGNAQRMTAAQDKGYTINYATGGTYAPQGGLASAHYGSSVVSTMFYNSRLELCRISVENTGTVPANCPSTITGNILDIAYGYASGNNGNIATQTNNTTSGRTQTYTYDPLNRLLTAQAQATSSGDCWGQSFGNGGPPPTMATDALANLFYTSSIKCSSPAPQYTVGSNNQFTGSGIGYDADGDMTQDTAYTYTYDAESRIITASGMANGPYCYKYDGNGMRVLKAHASGGSCTGTVTVDMLYWRDISGNAIAETDGTGSTTNSNYNEYVFFAGRRIAQSNPYSGNVYYYFADHLGSTRVVTNATGTACYEVDYLPYGTENTPAGFTNTAACTPRYRFTGYERDLETAYGTSAGNDYAFARYYNSRLGRFMSGDPLDGDITDPQTLNKYAYVRNNPLNLIDQLGMDFNCYSFEQEGGPVGTFCFDGGSGGGAGGGYCMTYYGGGCLSPATDTGKKPSQVKPPKPKKNKGCPGPVTNALMNTMMGAFPPSGAAAQAAQLTGHVVQVGIGGSIAVGLGATFGVGGGASMSLAFDSQGNVALVLSYGGGGGFGAGGTVALQASYSPGARTIFDLQSGLGGSYSAVAGEEAAVGGSVADDGTVTATFGPGGGVGTSAGPNKTSVIAILCQ